MPKDFNVEYDEYAREWQKVLQDPERQAIGETWLRSDTVDAWRHQRMRLPLRPIIKLDKEASWLTIGDGRFGTDAHFLLMEGAQQVHCTDISDTLLKIGQTRGFIQSFSAENAESLSFADNSFDFVYCKESLHHFARPYAALHEMFRVARQAVVLTEPRDTSIDKEPLSLLKDLVKILLQKKIVQSHGFESIGNYIFSISERELEKFMLGMHCSLVGFIGTNDVYLEGVEFVPLESQAPADIKIKKKIISEIERLDRLCSMGLRKSTMLTAALFKAPPEKKLLKEMTSVGWEIKQLPVNPYR